MDEEGGKTLDEVFDEIISDSSDLALSRGPKWLLDRIMEVLVADEQVKDLYTYILAHRSQAEAMLAGKLAKLLIERMTQRPKQPNTGYRVGAVQGINNTYATLFGYGVYDGKLPCPHLGGRPNPHITLDNGKGVWGCECWWGPEDQIKAKLAGLTVTMVDPQLT